MKKEELSQKDEGRIRKRGNLEGENTQNRKPHSGMRKADFGQPPRSLPLGHGAHDQHDEARRDRDRHFRFDG